MFKELDIEQAEVELGPREAFLRAKAELFLLRAVEAHETHRYHAVLKALDTVIELDPGNQESAQLRQDALVRLHYLAHSSGEPPTGSQNPGPRRPESVLIIDQDPRVLRGLGTTFRTYGFNVMGAESYKEGIEGLEYFTPNVIISEVNFEEGPLGIDLFQRAHEMQPNGAPVFVFLAARVDRDLEIAGRRAGVHHFVVKPFDNEVVATIVLSFMMRRVKVS